MRLLNPIINADLRQSRTKPQMCAELRQLARLNGCPSEVQSKDLMLLKNNKEKNMIIFLTLA